jgi:hypothetical protein
VKQQAPGSGYGGDWAVRIAASLSAAGQQQLERERAEAAAAAAAQGGDAAAAAAAAKAVRPKLSLLLYFADALWHAGALDMWPQGQQGKVGQVRRARHATGPQRACALQCAAPAAPR